MTLLKFKTEKGHPIPFGANRLPMGINFSLFSKQAKLVILTLYDIENHELIAEIPLDPKINKTGNIWHIFVETPTDKAIGYAYKIRGPLQITDPTRIILDPYSKAIDIPVKWGRQMSDSELYQPIGIVFPDDHFDWEDDAPPHIFAKDLIIYELHVRSFTQDSSSGVKAPGTFLGVIEKIPHLIELGVNALEFMPLQEFDETEYKVCNTLSKERLFQYWGYSTVNYFAPMNRYASNPSPGSVVNEFKTMVKALHKNGIAVILDIVFNHTSEGDINGPIHSFKGIDPTVYYMFNAEEGYLNFTGCGNTFNTNHPICIQFIIDVLRYWVLEMHVDGFRFDLASIFYRDETGKVLSRSPVIEAISQDPILASIILIAEPWDAVGLYQVGSFYAQEERWSEWNARYRDTIRRFIKGTPYLNGKFASRISGSEDLYSTRSPLNSINFIVAHDGFTLHDLVSYNQKHNLINGENNRDGLDNNESWNCGIEGITEDKEINALRARQMRNFHLALMISQGIPMLLMGDEYGHTKNGNNNTWCHDNQLNWFLWDKLKENEEFYRFYRLLISFRKKHSILRRERFFTNQDITWWGVDGQPNHWNKDFQFLAFTVFNKENKEDIYCAFNAQNSDLRVIIPAPHDHDKKWHVVANTANPSPEDIYNPGQEPLLEAQIVDLIPFSAVLLQSM